MPVLHTLGMRQTEHDTEYYGPWDGVLPRLYPNVYAKLLELAGMQARGLIYTDNNDVCHRKICAQCYRSLPQMYRASYEEGFNHIFTLQTHYIHFIYCRICLTQIYVRHATEKCSACIEEYFNLSQDEWYTIRNGCAVNVVTRW